MGAGCHLRATRRRTTRSVSPVKSSTEAGVKTTVEETKYVKEDKVDNLPLSGKRPQGVPQSSPSSKMPQSSEAVPEVQPVSVRGRSESKTEPLEEFVDQWKAHADDWREAAAPAAEVCTRFRSAQRGAAAASALAQRRAKSGKQRHADADEHFQERTDEVKYQKLSEAMARIHSKRRWRR